MLPEEMTLLRKLLPYVVIENAMRVIARADEMMQEELLEAQRAQISKLRFDITKSQPRSVQNAVNRLKEALDAYATPEEPTAKSQAQVSEVHKRADIRLSDLQHELDWYKGENIRLSNELDAVRRKLAAARGEESTHITPEPTWYMDNEAMNRRLTPKELAIADACRRGRFIGVLQKYSEFSGAAEIRQAYQQIIDKVYIPPKRRAQEVDIYPVEDG